METTIEYYMKGQAKQSKSFDTFKEAQAFMLGLSTNEKCESYGILRD